MRRLKMFVIVVFAVTIMLTISNRIVSSQSQNITPTGQANVALNDDYQAANAPIDDETSSTLVKCGTADCLSAQEAPTGFDDKTNDPNFVSQATHDADRAIFEERDTKEKGLGPVYNAQACSECHQNPVSGSVSQITELRAGHLDKTTGLFVDAPGGSLINDRAIDQTRPGITASFQNIQERVPPLFSAGINGEEDVRTTRTSLNLLGDGFVEAVANQTLINIAASQPNDQGSGGIVHGQAIRVPLEEAPNRFRIGRFGHKNQHASLLSFSGDAYLNEIGITNRLFLQENTSLGRDVSPFDFVPNDATIDCDPDPIPHPGQNIKCGEDNARDIDTFTRFMRASKAPPRDKHISATYDAQQGEILFAKISCTVCHVPSITTARAGTYINGGTFQIPSALGNKVFHPYGDFLLHDIGTMDGIVQNGGQKTRLKVRTAPLWGVRTHTRLMHDGLSLTFADAIKRHIGEADIVRQKFDGLTVQQQHQIITFLESL